MPSDPRFPNVQVLDHPLIQHKLTHLRDRTTSTRTFRQIVHEIALLMGYEATRDLPLTRAPVETPLASMQAPVISGRKLAVVPILRAGLAMADGLLELVPSARVGHIGVYRNDQHRPVEYLVRLPSAAGRRFVLCDPMLATGHSAAHAAGVLERHGVAQADMRLLALLAAPEGLEVLTRAFPGLRVYVAAIDQRLDENAYILPGLGDAGDRLYGTRH